MGKIEEKAKQKTKKNAHVQDAILLYFRTVGAMAAVILSPNPTMYKLLRQMDPNTSVQRNATHRIREAAIRLEKAGFVRLQDCVWVYPYPCEEFVAFIRADLRLGPGMLYIIAEEIEHDRHLKEHFGIPIS